MGRKVLAVGEPGLRLTARADEGWTERKMEENETKDRERMPERQKKGDKTKKERQRKKKEQAKNTSSKADGTGHKTERNTSCIVT